MSEAVVNVVFYALALWAVGGALAVALSRNIVRTSFALLAVLFAVAGLYGIMKSDLLLVVQMFIYVGGILVLIIFAIMLTHRITDVRVSNESSHDRSALFACLGIFLLLVAVGVGYPRWRRAPEPIRVPVTMKGGGYADVAVEQYQADGATGLPKGGATFEREVVLAFKLFRPVAAVSGVELRVFPIRDPGRAMILREPLQGTECKIRCRSLAEGPSRWHFRLNGADGPLTDWVPEPPTVTERLEPNFVVRNGLIETAGEGLMGRYLLPFELASVLLLAALVGAAFLARKEVR